MLKQFTVFAFASLLLSSVAFSEDSVTCNNDHSRLDVTVTDYNTLSVTKNMDIATLVRAEVKYEGFENFVRVTPKLTELGDKRISQIKLAYDNGTSVKKVYIVEWPKFDDGAEVPILIYNLYPVVPNGRFEYVKTIKCDAVQS